jgi:hypothetical protein
MDSLINSQDQNTWFDKLRTRLPPSRVFDHLRTLPHHD